nr:Pycsar system effector family protein [Modestobacter versicolor]
MLVTIVALSGSGRRLYGLDGGARVIFWIGVSAIILGVVAVALVVKPRVRRRDVAGEWPQNYIFFGHLQFWSPADLEVALAERPLLPVLTRQLVNMSKIAWRKHLLVEVSLLCAVVGTALVVLAALLR